MLIMLTVFTFFKKRQHSSIYIDIRHHSSTSDPENNNNSQQPMLTLSAYISTYINLPISATGKEITTNHNKMHPSFRRRVPAGRGGNTQHGHTTKNNNVPPSGGGGG